MEIQELSKHFSEQQFQRLQAALASIAPERREVMIRAFSKHATKAPKPGDKAPDFELPVLGDSARKVQLSSFCGKNPVALIFGSFT